ncbi:MAG: hypothetical protein LKF53_02030 [Solobacterium sp.]|nr:hypothetical protein [Solobacterium sp.]MCH4205157.1 hypothetical protein [Solobacterium sp.]MCH4226750.1 hypothetical protein [Solobacterium sp.]MCH4281921.1 hypothetical protein [Solobacterium sp.]
MQDKKGIYKNHPTDEMILLREIDAQEYLLSMSNRYKIPIEEVNVTKSNLDYYQNCLKNLKDKKGR